VRALSLGVPVTGDLAPAFQDGMYGCIGAAGPDLFYAFDATANGRER
jgi:hypothetical protein